MRPPSPPQHSQLHVPKILRGESRFNTSRKPSLARYTSESLCYIAPLTDRPSLIPEFGTPAPDESRLDQLCDVPGGGLGPGGDATRGPLCLLCSCGHAGREPRGLIDRPAIAPSRGA